MLKFVHRMNQTAHISLQILSISKSVETKTNQSAFSSSGAPARQSLFFSYPRRIVWPVRFPVAALFAASVKWYLGISDRTRKAFFPECRIILRNSDFLPFFRKLARRQKFMRQDGDDFFSPHAGRSRKIWSYPQTRRRNQVAQSQDFPESPPRRTAKSRLGARSRPAGQ